MSVSEAFTDPTGAAHYIGDDDYANLIMDPAPQIIVAEAEPSTYIPIPIKQLINSGDHAFVINHENLPYLLYIRDPLNLTLAHYSAASNYATLQAGMGLGTAISFHQMVNGTRNQFYSRCEGHPQNALVTYDSYYERFALYNEERTAARAWEKYVHELDIPMMKKLMTSTTPFTIHHRTLYIYARGMQWRCNSWYRTIVQPIIPTHWNAVSSFQLRIYANQYVVFQRLTNTIHYFGHDYQRLVVIPEQYDVLEFNFSSDYLWIVMTDKSNGMLYYCDSRSVLWACYMIGILHLYSTTPNLHINETPTLILCVKDNELTILHKNKFQRAPKLFN